ncbi:MAG: hypothetical protein AAFU77_16875 [Myxococcota bacterium]
MTRKISDGAPKPATLWAHVSRFPATAWTLILSSDSSDERRQTLRCLLEGYWKPLYLFARSRGLGPDDAMERTQGFCLKLLEHGLSDDLHPDRGRFRSYLCRSFERYVADEWRRDHAVKRGAHAQHDSAEAHRDSLADKQRLTPDEALDLKRRQAVLAQAVEALRSEFETGRWKAPFAAFEDAFLERVDGGQAVIAQRYGMSHDEFRAFYYRATKRLKDLGRSRKPS